MQHSSVPSWRLAAIACALAFGPAAASPAFAQGAPPVTVSKPLYEKIVEWTDYTGQFEAVETVDLRARVSGYLTEIHFTDGQVVQKGDLLFVIDPRPFEIALQSAQAALEEAAAREELAKRQLNRTSELRRQDFASVSAYDERVQEARAASAAVQSARAAVAAAELDLEFTRITAPVTGRIGAHQVDVGNLVVGGSTDASAVLASIVSLDPVHFTFDVSESDFLAYERAIAEGRLQSNRDGSVTVYVKLSDERDWPHAGRLDFVDNQISASSGTIRMRATFPNPEGFIAAGAFGRLRLPSSEPYFAVIIPDEAIVTDQSQKVVLSVSADGTVVPKVIRPGPRDDGMRIVRRGLSPDDVIIINGLMRARPGMKVTPQQGRIVRPERTDDPS